MSEAKFDTADSIQLKGSVKGVSRISKKAKMMVALVFAAVGVLIVTAAQKADEPVGQTEEQIAAKEAAEAKKSPALATPDVAIAGADDGRVASGNGGDPAAARAMATSPVEASAPAAMGPSFPAEQKVPSVATLSGVGPNPASATTAPVKNGNAGPGQVDLGGTSASGPLAPQQAGAQPVDDSAARRKQELDQKARDARMASMDPQGFQDNGKGASAVQQSVNAMVDQLKNAAAASATGNVALTPLASSRTPYGGNGEGGDDQNKQARKEAFLKTAEAATTNTYLKQTKLDPLSPYEIKAGWSIPAELLTNMNSDLPGQVIGQVRENVFDSATGRFLLIPQGTKTIGTYDSQVAIGQERFLVVWQRLIFPDGSSISLEGMPGADKSGAAGFDADVDNHYLRLYGNAFMMSMVAGGLQLSQKESNSSNSTPTSSQTMASAVGQQLGTVSTQMIQQNMKIQATLKQRFGYRFNIMVTKDLLFQKAYRSR